MKMTQLDNLMKEIVKLYFISLRNLQEQSFASENDSYSPYLKYFNDVEKAFSKLSAEKKRLITKEYFYDDYPGWWIKEYRLSKFSRLKKTAVKEFVVVFYEIH